MSSYSRVREGGAASVSEGETTSSGDALYLHSNGYLLSESITPLSSEPRKYVQAVDPRADTPGFEVCSSGNTPNPCETYTTRISGRDIAPTATFWSWLVFQWATPLLAAGFKRDISSHDLCILPERLLSREYTPPLFKAWHDQKHRTRYRFQWAMWQAFKPTLIRMWMLRIVMIGLTLVRPVVLSLLLRGITNGDDASYSFLLICVLAALSMLQALATQHFWWQGVSVAMASRGSCIALVFDKTLKLHSCERAVWTSGRISNLANVDCDTIRDFSWGAVHEIWAGPVLIIFASSGLFLLLGVSALVGMALMVLSIVITGRLAKKLSDLQDEVMHHGDHRVNLMSELVNSIKLIKLYSWESFFERKIRSVRADQMRTVLKQSIIGSISRCLGLIVPMLVSMATFSVFILTDGYGSLLSNTLDAPTAWTAALLFNMLRAPLAKLPECIGYTIRYCISVSRVEDFLVAQEREHYVAEESDPATGVTVDGTFDWAVAGALQASLKEAAAAEAAAASAAVVPASTTSTRAHNAPLHVISTDADDEEEEEEEEDDDDLPTSLADEIRREKALEAKAQKKRSKAKLTKRDAKSGASEERQSLTNGPDSEDLVLELDLPRAEGSATLPKLQLRIPAGQLWMLVGSVASGKSSLLASILGEMSCLDESGGRPPSIEGEDDFQPPAAVTRPRRIAYTSQVSWLKSASIKDNILFGLPYNEQRYKETLHACALEPDISRFAAGDETIVGENGLTLSGGQKARMVFARAVYSDSDLYLLDEPLAAVDAHVARWLFERAIGPSSVLRHKTRILATHQIQFCSPQIDCIVVLREGRIVAQGTYDEVQAQGVDLHSILEQTHNLANADEDESDATMISEGTNEPASATTIIAPSPKHDRVDFETAEAAKFAVSPVPVSPPIITQIDDNSATSATEAKPAVEAPVQYGDEDLQLGRMKSDVWKQYFNAGASTFGYIFLAVAVVASQSAAMASDYFLAYWSTSITHAVAQAQVANANNHASNPANMPLSIASPPHVLMALGQGHSWQSAAIHGSSSLMFSAAANASINGTLSYTAFLPHSTNYYISCYGLIVMVGGALLLLRSIYIAFTTVTAARVLHDRLFAGIVRAPQWFFESTPSGRILNRFSKDVSQVDIELPSCVQDILECGVTVCGTVVLIMIVAPASILPLIVIGFIYQRVQNFYRPVSRQLKRLESVTRSPIYQQLGETASGITTIRAYSYGGSLSRCMEETYSRIDVNTRLMYYSFSVHRWLGIRLEAIGALIVLVASSLALALHESLGVGLVGLAISATLGLAGELNWAVRQVSEMENQLNSVERMVEYAQVAPEQDPDAEGAQEDEEPTGASPQAKEAAIAARKSRTPSKKMYTSLAPSSPSVDDDSGASVSIEMSPSGVPASWPSGGAIEFRDIALAYRPDPAYPRVLSGVNASIRAGEKIGVVGRTGAGKSTLSLALFRLIDVRQGSILIDGIDIATVPLHTLRSRLSIIPQDPLLFQASLRDNLDPYRTVTDARLWEVLDMVQLRSNVASLAGGLDHMVQDGGENFSLGQRQLLCLARALVRGSRVVVMDEATSSLDYENDQKLKRIVSEHFAACTVITIAHRLNTILDADRIAVFEAGKLVEFDTPKKLLADSKGYLSYLVNATNSAGRIHQEG